ncbi:hypothetical protein HA49_02145 [Tatumella morbirosei]|uniref:FAD dependent oxidoreductase domain-containing protein n=1 Tax=Tatumella morbirosei TaxID=642227 RepID=A0A095TS57_9GAMM|nr:N-methyl-L-tryptophan oxidase [Tatumella morbirosei]KGD79409.1 hypothetical protein HA49_02145 [Tatumella morbirosei]
MKVAVIGLGAMGSMTLWQLAQAGVSVDGFEQFGLGSERSGIGGESRLFRTAYKEGAHYVPLLKRSRQLWQSLEQQTGTSLLTLCGGLTIGQEDDDGISKVLQSIRQFDIAHQRPEPEQARRLYPGHRFHDDEIVIFDQESGYLRPELAVTTALRKAADLGAAIYSHCQVEAIDTDSQGAFIRVNGSLRRYDKVLVTAGGWVRKLFPVMSDDIFARKLILSWFPARDISWFTPPRFPIFTRRTEGYFSFGVPSIEGSMVKIGISTPGHVIADIDKEDFRITETELEATRYVIRNFMNGLSEDPVRTSGHPDAFSSDKHCVIGHPPGQPDLLLMSGFSGHGFKLAPAMGEIAMQMLCEKRLTLSVDEFSLQRLNLFR